LRVFRYQASHNPVYKRFLEGVQCDVDRVTSIFEIPFLPISFFKSHKVVSDLNHVQKVFFSSGTTGMERSQHHLTDVRLYETSFRNGFQHFFGNIEDYIILALLPSYQEQENSSLVYMITDLIKQTKHKDSGFFLHNYDALTAKLEWLDRENKKVLLIGVTYALLDLIETKKLRLKNTIVMETGGMKGRRKEMIKSALHLELKNGFGVDKVYSEYGMTELLSQAYSLGNELFSTPPWMRVLIREVEDPLCLLPHNKTGGINIIDLANINSCSFISTQDLGKTHKNGTFQVLGRFDHSDIRGCNLMLSDN